MSSVICETHQSSFSMSVHTKEHGRFHWPFGSTSRERTGKPPALRIVTSETSPNSSANGNSILPAPGVRVHVPTSSSRAGSTEAPDAIHQEQAQHRNAGQRPEVPFPRRPSGHARTQSTSTVGECSASPGSLSARSHRRTRTAYSATPGGEPRPRLPSMLASVLTQNNALAQPRESTNDPDLLGSFAPTSSPRPRLRSLLSGTCTPPEFSSALTPSRSSPSQRPALPSRALSVMRPRYGYATERPRRQSETLRAGVPRHWHASEPGPIDPPASPDLPSICRTPSSYSDSDYLPTAPSSAGPTTPVHTAGTLPMRDGRNKSETPSLHPVLENLERTSLFRVQTACATCGKLGSNFPCCPKCGEMWCSRPCRLQKGNGKRHICSKKAE